MHLNEWSLRAPARRAARIAALELLARVHQQRDRLDDPADVEALHDFRVAVRRLRSWLRAFDEVLSDTLSAKGPRRLHAIAEATGASRDLEVHLAWTTERRRTLRGDLRKGADWLIDHLAARKAESDKDLRDVVDAKFDRAMKNVERAMSCYTAAVLLPEAPFAAVAATLVRRHASKLAKALRAVSGLGDRAEAHEARIAAKRLRYLLDPLEDAVPDVEAIVDALGEMQDRLGELHDAQLFGSEIASIVARQLAHQPPSDYDRETRQDPADADDEPDGDNADLVAAAPRAGNRDDPVPGLLTFARRLRRAEETAFAAAERLWLHDGAAPLLARVAAVADALDDVARHAHETERTYLLKKVPTELPAGATQSEVVTGLIAGDALVESVRRETTATQVGYSRNIIAGTGADRVALDDVITERLFAALWPLTRGSRLHARLTRIESHDHLWTVHEFLDRSLVLATVGVVSADDVPPIPKWLEAVLERDVTDDPAYARSGLAK